MKKINNIFDCLENAEGSEMERITNKTPQLDDKQLERILDMSERKYNIKKRNEINTEMNEDYQTAAEGVEKYTKRPVWHRFAATAAVLVLAGGITAAGLRLLKDRNEVPVVPTIPNIAATTVVTTTDGNENETAEITTVTADLSAVVSDTVTTDTAVSNSSSAQPAAQTTQPAPNPDNSGNTPAQQSDDSAPAAPNALSEDQCRAVLKQVTDEHVTYEEIVQVPIKEYLDLSDTFTATCQVTRDTFADGHSLLDEPNNIEVKFVHYVDPKFNSISDIRNFVVNWADRWNGGRTFNTDKMFGQSITPDQIYSTELYIVEDIYVYTEYNGKIYRGISTDLNTDDLQSHDQYYTSECMSLRWGNDYIRNITDSSFDDYRISEDGNGGYYGIYRYYYNDGSGWKEDTSKQRQLNNSDCLQFIQ